MVRSSPCHAIHVRSPRLVPCRHQSRSGAPGCRSGAARAAITRRSLVALALSRTLLGRPSGAAGARISAVLCAVCSARRRPREGAWFNTAAIVCAVLSIFSKGATTIRLMLQLMSHTDKPRGARHQRVRTPPHLSGPCADGTLQGIRIGSVTPTTVCALHAQCNRRDASPRLGQTDTADGRARHAKRASEASKWRA